ncbi:questin oxidase family protein [Kribbella sp. NPDC050281]|uniref:questin oxidase family protein n=1 Tax=Kribbella sp. NPDC050281 TaxID=3155515 RepID=UPI0033E6B944
MRVVVVDTDDYLDEAYERLRDTGPERDGWLSNHAPMAVEALTRRGRGAVVHRWLDEYHDKLESRPRGLDRIHQDSWRDPLGDPLRTGDWLNFFEEEVRERDWREVLARWWPRLLPGIAAGATHGVIRVGHAVRALADEETQPRVVELAHGLAYWAARWQPLAPAGEGPYGANDPRSALDSVPRVADQRFGIRHRLAQLAVTDRWSEASGAVPGTGEIRERLASIVQASVLRYGTHGHGSPVMLVHASTAPNAVLRTLPELPQRLWQPSLEAAWAATAAVTAAYSPSEPRPPSEHHLLDPEDVMSQAVAGGDEHAIKFVDTAIDFAEVPGVLDAGLHAIRLIA